METRIKRKRLGGGKEWMEGWKAATRAGWGAEGAAQKDNLILCAYAKTQCCCVPAGLCGYNSLA